ncbi:MAG: DNA internalization-related competence protein ComEC/Rec2 [Pseudomonadota bacterium]
MLSWYQLRAEDETPAAQYNAPARGVHPGERWRLSVRLKRPHGNANPYGFDYEAWLFERNIRATGYVRANNAHKVDGVPTAQRLDEFVWRPAYFVEFLRDVLYQRFMRTLPDAPYVGVLLALTVGEQRIIPNAQWQVFNRTGITHLVSISGLHVTMVAALFAMLVRQLWRRSERLSLAVPAQKAALVAGWLAALFYALLAGFAVPTQRTLYMLSVVALALCSGRNWGVSRILLFALLLVLLLDPWAVLAAGFWLSFGAVALLFFVGTARLSGAAQSAHQHGLSVSGAVTGVSATPSLAPADAAGRSTLDAQHALTDPSSRALRPRLVALWQRYRSAWRPLLAEWSATQWAVTLGSLPILLLLFQQFSLVSPLANAIAIPVVSFLITPLALFFALLNWPPLLYLAHGLMSALMWLLEYLARWPIWQQAAPPAWASLLAGVGVVCVLLPRGFPARWLGLIMFLPAFLTPALRPALGEVWLDVIDVGQGLAVLVRTEKHNLLYDTGPLYSAESDAGQRIVVPYLRALGVEHLDTLLLSHRDKDHAGGLRSVQDAVTVRRTLSSLPELAGDTCSAGQSWTWDAVRFSVLYPLPEHYSGKVRKSNNMSCVLRVEKINGQAASVLLSGDIEARDERSLLKLSPELLASDILLAPHHGSRTSSTPAFVAAVAAREVIFPVGYRNRFNHPRPEIVERYAGARLWRSDDDGAVRIILADKIDLTAYRKTHRRYWFGV